MFFVVLMVVIWGKERKVGGYLFIFVKVKLRIREVFIFLVFIRNGKGFGGYMEVIFY